MLIQLYGGPVYSVYVTRKDRKLLKWKQLDALISHIYFWNKTLHVSGSSSVHHQEFFTVHTAMVYVIQFCWQLASRIRTEHPDSVWNITLLCVQWKKTPDDGQRNCPKRVEFCTKNKFEKLVHLFGFYKNLSRCTVTWTSKGRKKCENRKRGGGDRVDDFDNFKLLRGLWLARIVERGGIEIL